MASHLYVPSTHYSLTNLHSEAKKLRNGLCLRMRPGISEIEYPFSLCLKAHVRQESGPWVQSQALPLTSYVEDGAMTWLLGCWLPRLWKEGLIWWLQSSFGSHACHLTWVSKGWVERSVGGRNQLERCIHVSISSALAMLIRCLVSA